MFLPTTEINNPTWPRRDVTRNIAINRNFESKSVVEIGRASGSSIYSARTSLPSLPGSGGRETLGTRLTWRGKFWHEGASASLPHRKRTSRSFSVADFLATVAGDVVVRR